MCDCFCECGPEEGWEPGGDARDFQYPTEHWGGAPARADLPFYHRCPPAPGRPPVTGGQSNVTSRDPGREAPFGKYACAVGPHRPRKRAPANCGGGGQATGGKRVWSRPPGCWGWDQPGRAETGKEGCPAGLKVPEVPEANSRAVRRPCEAVLLPGLSQLCRVVGSGRTFLLAALFEWNGG